MNPDLSQGIIREKDGKRFFLRLWPSPVFLQQCCPSTWRDVENVGDDFNHTGLVEMQDRIVERHKEQNLDLVVSILQEQKLIKDCDPPEELQMLLLLQRRIKQREQFLRPIPADMLCLVLRFPEEHFHLLQFLAAYPEACELTKSNPMIAFLLATRKQWRNLPELSRTENLRDILRRDHSDILAELGFHHADKSLASLTRSISPWACRSELIAGLRETLRIPQNIQRLRNIKRINLGAMAIAADKSLLARVTDAFLHEVAEDKQEDWQTFTAERLRVQVLMEEDVLLSRKISRFKTIKELQVQITESAIHLTSIKIKALALSLPEPPFEDTPDIQSLRTCKAVFEEGDEQCNKAWFLLPQLLSGRMFLYRVLAPERVTFGIIKQDGAWSIKEVESPMWGPMSSKTRECIENWLNNEIRYTSNCSSMSPVFDLLKQQGP